MMFVPAVSVADQCGGVNVGTPGLSALCGKSGAGSSPIYSLLGAAINYLLALIGAVAVLAIVVSGIQYITSQGEPDALKKAKDRITNAVVGLILLSLTFAIMRFLGVS
jgi:hypothetical protein